MINTLIEIKLPIQLQALFEEWLSKLESSITKKNLKSRSNASDYRVIFCLKMFVYKKKIQLTFSITNKIFSEWRYSIIKCSIAHKIFSICKYSITKKVFIILTFFITDKIFSEWRCSITNKINDYNNFMYYITEHSSSSTLNIINIQFRLQPNNLISYHTCTHLYVCRRFVFTAASSTRVLY